MLWSRKRLPKPNSLLQRPDVHMQRASRGKGGGPHRQIRGRPSTSRPPYLAPVRPDFRSDRPAFQDSVPMMAGSQPFDPVLACPVPVIKKQLCFESVVAWKRRSNDKALYV